MRCRATSERGFTLVEVVVALTAFSFLMIIFASAVPLAEKTAHMNGQYAQAISLCQHKIDQVRAVGYGRITYDGLSEVHIIDESPGTLPFSFVTEDAVSSYLSQPTATLNVQDIAPGQVKVTASITWRSANHQSRTSNVSISAIIANVE